MTFIIMCGEVTRIRISWNSGQSCTIDNFLQSVYKCGRFQNLLVEREKRKKEKLYNYLRLSWVKLSQFLTKFNVELEIVGVSLMDKRLGFQSKQLRFT